MFKEIKEIITRTAGMIKADCLILLILAVIGIIFVSGIEKALDIRLYDESKCLYQGVTLRENGLPAASEGPLYVIWYYILSLFCPDRINLYYFNYKLMTILPALALYILLRSRKCSPLIALIVSSLLMISAANFPVWPKVSHFALLLLLVVLALSSCAKRFETGIVCSALGALVVSYVRPEYFLAYILFLSISVVISLINIMRREFRKSLPLVVLLVLFSAGLIYYLGIPISGAGRSAMAFGQHFGMNWVNWTHGNLNPWFDWKEIVEKNFGVVCGPFGAAVANPSLFLKHVWSNLLELRHIIFRLFVYPAKHPSSGIMLPELIIAYFSLLILLVCKLRWTLYAISEGFRRNKRMVVCIAPYLLITLLSGIVLYPREHYLLPLGVMLLISLVLILGKSGAFKNEYKWCVVIGLSLAFTVYAPPESRNLETVETIKYIDSLNIDKPVSLLDSDGGYSFYLGNNYSWVPLYEKQTGFAEFMVRRNINAIVLRDWMCNNMRYKNDEEWRDFMRSYGDKGFVGFEIPNSGGKKLIIKKNLLKNESVTSG